MQCKGGSMTPGTVDHAKSRRLIMGVIKRAPLISPLLFRAYNHILQRMSAEHDARAYFGAKFRCNLDDMIPRMIFYFGFWEPNNSALIGSILEPGDVFVDVGANIGYYTLLGSSLVGPQGRVVSIEPLPAIFAQLQDNTSVNGAANTRLVNLAVSDATAELLLYGGTRWNRGATSTVVHDAGQEPEAKVLAEPLDALLLPEELERVALIKIDIEGAELPVLQRILDTLDRYPDDLKILVEMAPQVSGERLSSVFNGFLAGGFEAFVVENEYDTDWYLHWRSPCPLLRIDTLPERQIDVLFVRGSARELLAKWSMDRNTWPVGRASQALAVLNGARPL
jgi:FkbM family methyltransferase